LRGTLILPMLTVEREVGGVQVERLSGLSDATALFEWRLAEDSPWTLVGGMQLPTGEDKKNPAPGVVPPSLLQLGSGTWDPILGVRWNGAWRSLDTWGSLTSLMPLGESDAGLEPGAVYLISAGASWAATSDLRLVLGVEDSIRSKDVLLGDPIENTSSSVISVVPGLSWRFADRWALGLRARVPVYFAMDGTQLVPGPLFEFAVDWTP
jgi:hypothetical protein